MTSDATDPNAIEQARKCWRTLEPFHGMIYFVPEAAAAYESVGVDGRSGYFGSRSAPMGAVGPLVVQATFFNFHPELVHRAMDGLWDDVTPSRAAGQRHRAVDEALRRFLGDEVDSPGHGRRGRPAPARRRRRPRATRRSAAVRRPCRAARCPTRPISPSGTPSPCCASSGATDTWRCWPRQACAGSRRCCSTAPAARFRWTCSRPHVPGPTTSGPRPSTASGPVVCVDADQHLTDAGANLRDGVEDRTDELATRRGSAISADDAERVRTIVRPWSKAISASAFG